MPTYHTLTNNSEDIGRTLRFGLRTKARRAAELWAEGIVQVMADSEKAGRRYYYPGLGWTRASLPGRPPAIQTGRYARSIQARRVGNTSDYAVGTDLMVGRWVLGALLEYGTENMAPRPHFRQGYERNRDLIRRELGEEIDG